VADFQANVTTGCAPVSIRFEDRSEDAVAWEWDLGVTSSVQQNPVIFYLQPGVYDIRLIVTDANGLRDTLLRRNYIAVYAPPRADFQADDTLLCTGETIQFSDLSTKGSGDIIDWSWAFGNGQFSHDQNPQYAYPGAGIYNVRLKVTDENGCTAIRTRRNYIETNGPQANFTVDKRTGCNTPFTVNFTSTQSSGTHFWDFGDGNTSTAVNPVHTYTQYGQYTVLHQITSALGCVSTTRKENFIFVGNNTLAISLNDTSYCEGEAVGFSTNAPSNSSLLWDFGDGNTSTAFSPSHVYATADTFEVQLQVSETNGCTSNLTQRVIINPYPIPAFTVDGPTKGCELPFEVQFQDQSQGAISWYWLTGDSHTYTSPNPFHTYTREDSFTVILAVRGPGGCLRTAFGVDYIVTEELQAAFSADVRGGCVPLEVQFADTTQHIFPITSRLWDFGDGTTSTQENPVHTYTQTGWYTVKLILSNSEGCTDTLVKQNYIGVGTPPTVDFEADTLRSCARTDVQFTNLSQGADQYVWDFGDGTRSSQQHPRHQFVQLGWLDVELTASDKGCENSLKKPQYIEILAPLPQVLISDRTLCDIPATVSFSNLSQAADSWQWHFGDPANTTSTENHPTFTYTEEGTYVVTLSGTNDSTGCSATFKDSIKVLTLDPLMISNVNRGCGPLTVYFADLSQNASSWYWDFGNGKTSSLQYPGSLYDSVGTYDVFLRVSNAIGCADSIFMPNYIEVLGVEASFGTQDTLLGCAPLPVQLRDSSYGTANIVQWDWDFGDGQSSSQQHPQHVFTEEGIYDILLTVTDADGCMDSLRRQSWVEVTRPVANFSADYPINCPGNPIYFADQSSGKGLVYLWDFGDGTTETIPNPKHSYAQPGTYTVSLTVTDVYGCVDNMTKTAYITIAELPNSFEADTLSSSCPPLDVRFHLTDSCIQGLVDIYWDFGDGGCATDCNPSYTYTSAGQFDVTVTMSSPSGCGATITRPGLIKTGGPQSSVTITGQAVCPGSPVSLQAQSDTGVDFEWVLGDGSTASGASVVHTYAEPGIYIPVLISTDSLGCRVLAQAADSVVVYSPPLTDFRASDTVLCDAGVVQFYGENDPQVPVFQWQWEMGDGQTENGQSPAHFFQHSGSYDIRLITTSGMGCTDTLTKTAFIEVLDSPQPLMAVSDTSGCAPQPIAFQALAPLHANGQVVSWSWNTGDGSSQQGAQFQHTYQAAGTYKAKLLITDEAGCVGSTDQTIVIHEPEQATFSASSTSGCAPFEVQFTDESPNAQSWLWDFGDGTTSIAQHPVHTYTQKGPYQVKLSTTDINGCTSSYTYPSPIEVSQPEAALALSTQQICVGDTLRLQDQSQSVRPLLSWEWSFGDGNGSMAANPTHAYSQAGMYDIQLVIQTDAGCRDTLLLQQAVEVFPLPQTQLLAADTAACMPFAVQLSTAAVQPPAASLATWKWNMGDGSQYQQPSVEHTYHTAGTYTVVLEVTDTRGCSNTLRQLFTAYPLPVANFALQDSFGCAPFQALFSDQSTKAVSWQWDFGDGSSSTQQHPTHEYAQDGTYTVSLAVTDSHGCSDTLSRTNLIHLAHPQANFTQTDSVTCPGSSISFTDLSQADSSLLGWHWDFGDGASSAEQHPNHVYTQSGNYDVSLTVTDVFGCTHRFARPQAVQVMADAPPAAVDILTLDVVSDEAISIQFHAYPNLAGDFAAYQLYRSTDGGAYGLVKEIFQPGDTLILDNGLQTRNHIYCYKVLVKSRCGSTTPLEQAGPHCSILLQTFPAEGEVQLQWSPYTGWEPESYRLYRTPDYGMGQAQLLSTVAGHVREFTDTDVSCRGSYTYRVQAVARKGRQSFSNIQRGTPTHTPPTDSAHIVVVSVEDNQYVSVEWEAPEVPGLNQLILEKNDGTGFRELYTQSVGSTNKKYQDEQVAVDEQAYAYRVFAADSCGDKTPLGRTGNSIHLSAKKQGGQLYFNWNPYQGWAKGVATYSLEVFDEQTGLFEQVAEIPGNQTEFVAQQSQLDQPVHCYRIIAHELGGKGKLSISNERCSSPDPQLFSANAFSPNDDGINDIFLIKSAFLNQFELTIFNRWGRKVFHSTDIQQGWDGHLPGGGIAPQGVYVFVARGVSLNGEVIQRQGSVMLIR